MSLKNWFSVLSVSIVFLGVAQRSVADTYPVILTGTVTMEDGTPPPFSVSIERSCTDSAGGTPGPLVNKKGEWTWRIEVDAFAVRACVFKALHPGYTSSTADASNLNVTSHATTLKVPTLVLYNSISDPYIVQLSGDNFGKARGAVQKALKAMDAHHYEETGKSLEEAVAAAPKLGLVWHALGVVDEILHKQPEAREAYAHAIEADPKLFPAYVTLTRLCIKTRDWPCALSTSDALLKVDSKRTYPEIYLHKAVAQYQLKDLPGAEQSAGEAVRQYSKHKKARAEYVDGRILEAKGDTNGAREHIAKYLTLDPNAADADTVKQHLENIGKPENVEPELEPL